MAERVYKLQMHTPFHIGTGSIDRESTLPYIPSDTLFSAIVSTWGRIDPMSVDDKLLPFLAQPANPTFLITSAFPFAGPVRFFPRPLRFLDVPDNLPHKRIKKANWVSEGIFNQLRQGNIPTDELDEKNNFIQRKQMWVTRAERKQIIEALQIVDVSDEDITIWQSSIAPRVTVDRLGSGSNIFHTGRIKFNPGCGLWFAARGSAFSDLEQGLTVLQDEGFGGLRSTGHGAFTFSLWENVSPFSSPQPGEYYVSLARFAPLDEAEIKAVVAQPDTAYTLSMVKGWCQDDVSHPWRRKRIRVIDEGAYLRCHHTFAGHLADLTPATNEAMFGKRRVYRYGFAFPVGTV